MAAFDDMQDLLVDFLTEATDLLENVDLGLVELEQRPDDHALLNQIFRGFHTVKGGAGFLEATALVELCHRGENLLDLLRGSKLQVNAEIMDLILAATTEVRRMFGEMSSGMMPTSAPEALLRGLEEAAEGKAVDTSFLRGGTVHDMSRSEVLQDMAVAPKTAPAPSPVHAGEPDWALYYHGLFGEAPPVAAGTPAPAPAAAPKAAPRPAPTPAPGRPSAAPAGGGGGASKESTIRVDTVRFDQILTLSGEIGLTKNRLNVLRGALLLGQTDDEVR